MKKIVMITIIILSAVIGFAAGKFESDTYSIKEHEKAVQENLAEPTAKKEEPGSVDFYRQMEENLDLMAIYDSSDITLEMLENRNEKIIVEMCIGMVKDEDTGDGIVINCEEPSYYYINYSSVDGIKDGDIVLTYFIYNPDTNYADDIICRFDYVLDGKI